MRVRVLAAATLAATSVLVPFAATAHAVTTTATLVAFAADPDGDDVWSIYTRPADGSGSPTELFSTTDDLWSPALSPDAARIAYTEANPTDREYSVYVRPVAGGAATRLTTGVDDRSLAWSRDGSTIAFVRGTLAHGDIAVWTVPADGSAAATKVAGSEGGGQPAFSPSGRPLLMNHYNSSTGDPDAIDVLTLSTHTKARLAGTGGGWSPAYSPDGQRVVFVKYLVCGTAILSVPSGGGTPVTIRSQSGIYADSPQYTNDGTQLFWNQTPRNCSNGVWGSGDTVVAASDGTGRVLLGATPALDEAGLSVGGGPLAADTTAPDAPVISTVWFTPTYAALLWAEASPDATEFAVVRKPHGDPAPISETDPDVVFRGAVYPGADGNHGVFVTGLTTGTTYDLYVFAIDASGNASAPSAVHSVTPAALPVVTQIGTVSTVSKTASFTVAWTSSSPHVNVSVGERHKLSTGWSGVTYTTLYADTTATSLPFTGIQGHSYSFQVEALDSFGNLSAPGTAWADVPMDDSTSGMAYSAGWTKVASSSRWLSTYHWTTAASKTLSLKRETNRFQVIGDKCSTCGRFRVYVDGVLKATVDSYASATANRKVLWTSAVFSGLKYHTIKIVTLATAGRPRVDIDAIGLYRH
jgi:Tol biopolymer transport system component